MQKVYCEEINSEIAEESSTHYKAALIHFAALAIEHCMCLNAVQ